MFSAEPLIQTARDFADEFVELPCKMGQVLNLDQDQVAFALRMDLAKYLAAVALTDEGPTWSLRNAICTVTQTHFATPDDMMDTLFGDCDQISWRDTLPTTIMQLLSGARKACGYRNDAQLVQALEPIMKTYIQLGTLAIYFEGEDGSEERIEFAKVVWKNTSEELGRIFL